MHKCSFTGIVSKIQMFQPELLLREIDSGGNIGGWNGFRVSSVYLNRAGTVSSTTCTMTVALDVLGGSQKLLLPLYHQFHDWILEYDLEKT